MQILDLKKMSREKHSIQCILLASTLAIFAKKEFQLTVKDDRELSHVRSILAGGHNGVVSFFVEANGCVVCSIC